jgi:hypothetical protein
VRRVLRDLRNFAVFLWAWYAFPVMEALGLRSRQENAPGDTENALRDPSPESPLSPENPGGA